MMSLFPFLWEWLFQLFLVDPHGQPPDEVGADPYRFMRQEIPQLQLC
jgi:hypothetical protein